LERKLRIVHCFRSPVGGIFRHVRDLVDAQVAAGHQVGIVCDSATGGEFELHRIAEVEGKLALGLKRTAMQRHIGPGDLGAAWRTYQLIRELKPNVLHGHGAKGGAYSRLFGTLFRASRSRVARIYTPHGGSLHYDEASATGRVIFLLERLLGRVTDQLLFVSDYELQTYIRKVGMPRFPYRLVYNGLRAEEFEPVATRPDAADFLYIGMMRDLKGPDLFIDALVEAASRTGRRLTAAMVGDGADLPRYKQMAAQAAERVDVAFYPAMPARDAFGMGRVVVVPSRAEAMPYIVLEALAAGRPMMATAVGGIPEIFGRDSAALAEPTGASLARLMTWATRDPEAFRAAMPAQADLLARFSAAVMAERIETTYRQALGED
jgi:glycosyltransferase involved in cell wall biosynthesis